MYTGPDLQLLQTSQFLVLHNIVITAFTARLISLLNTELKLNQVLGAG